MLFNAKTILLEEQQWSYLTHNWKDKGVHTFPKGFCPKVNVIVQLEFEDTTTIPRFVALTIKPRGYPAVVGSLMLYYFITRTLTKRLWEKLHGNYTRKQRVIFRKSYKQQPTNQQLNGYLFAISQTIQDKLDMLATSGEEKTNL